MVLLLCRCKRGQDCVDSAQIEHTRNSSSFWYFPPISLLFLLVSVGLWSTLVNRWMHLCLSLCCPMLIAFILARFLWVSFSLVQISARNLVVVWESKFIHLMHFNLNTSYTPLCGIIPDTSKWKENLGQTQELLKGWLSEAGTTLDFLGRAGGQGLDAWATVPSLLPPCPEPG